MDIQMPFMDGYECTKLIREYESTNNLPPSYIIGLSAYKSEEAKESGKESGMNDFILKPVSVEAVKTILNTLKN